MLLLPLAYASGAPKSELPVELFGQPCLLQGPTKLDTLKVIHSLSPEQLFPNPEAQLDSAIVRHALNELRGAKAPSALDRYRERLIRRLEAQLGLLDAMDGFRKRQDTAPLLAVGRKHLRGKALKDFESRLRKPAVLKKGLEALFESYSDAIEPDPQDEFHNAIHRIQVQYTCAFEEHGDPAAEKTGP